MPGVRFRAGEILAVAAGLAVALTYWFVVGAGSPSRGLVAIDHGELLFEDFVRYYLPQGRELLAEGSGSRHLDGCYATPSAAMLFAAVAMVASDVGVAAWCWGAVQGGALSVSLFVAVALAGGLAGDDGAPGGRPAASGPQTWTAFAVAAGFGLSAPIGHALAWGQMSTLATALVAAAAFARARGHGRYAGILFALATLAKPWALLAGPAILQLCRSSWLAAGVTFVLCGLALPAWGFGVDGLTQFVVDLRSDVAAARVHFAVDPNSQHVAHVVMRFLRVPAGDRAELGTAVWPLCAGLAALWSVATAAVFTRRLGAAAPLVALLAVPLLTPTAWPHDLQVVTVLLVVATLASTGYSSTGSATPRRRRCIVGLLSTAWVLQSAPLAHAIGPRWYGAVGAPLAALALTALVLMARSTRATVPMDR